MYDCPPKNQIAPDKPPSLSCSNLLSLSTPQRENSSILEIFSRPRRRVILTRVHASRGKWHDPSATCRLDESSTATGVAKKRAKPAEGSLPCSRFVSRSCSQYELHGFRFPLQWFIMSPALPDIYEY